MRLPGMGETSRRAPRDSFPRSPHGPVGAWRRALSIGAAQIVALSLALGNATSPALAAATCASSGPATYTVTVCINAPANGATVTGNAAVSADVTISGTSPGVQRMRFSLDGGYLITDFEPPYAFQLPSANWVDGSHSLAAKALLRDGFTSANTTITLTFANGVTQPPPLPTGFTPHNVGGTHPVVAAVGDGPDGSTAAQSVGSLIGGWTASELLYLGDVYEEGSPTEFQNWYDGSAYGSLRGMTNPTVGNHEYSSSTSAAGYFGYWRSPPHYYATSAGAWKLIALDSTSQYGQVTPGTAQYDWLVSQLSGSPCVAVYFHHPAYSIGPQGGDPRLTQLWQLLVDSGVDLVLTGHDHSYQRWKPLDRLGVSSASGLTQFVVGSGGHGIQAFVRSDTRVAAGFDSSPAAFGALRLTLNQSGAGYVFADVNGDALDYGSVKCSGTPTDVAAPTAVSDLSASAPFSNSVKLQWSPALDDVGIARYDVYRNGSLLASAGGNAYTDATVAAGTTYTYRVVALDAAGNASPLSNTASVTTPSLGSLLFSDAFESGTMASWARVTAVTAQAGIGMTGSFGAHAVAASGSAWADTPLPAPQTDLYYRVRFNLISTTAGANTYLLRLRNATLGSIIGVYASSTGKLAYRNDVAGVSVLSTVAVSTGAWHELQLHVNIAGATGLTETWLDGTKVDALSRTENLGTVAVGRLQIGDNATPRTYDLVLDDVAASLSYIGTAPPSPPPDRTPPSAPGTLTASATGPNAVTLNWGAATDNVAVTGYDVYRGVVGDPDQSLMLITTVPGTARSYSDTVAPATSYQYQLRARDAANNVSTPGNIASVTTPPLPSAGSVTFAAVADSYVDASKPTTNYGSAVTLRFDASPVVVSYLRFTVTGVAGTVSKVTLRLYANSSNSAGCSVASVADNTWGEKSITSANAPPLGAALATCGPLSSGTWKEIDLTASGVVTGNGTFSFALSTTSSKATSLGSRESSSGPQLVVTFAS